MSELTITSITPATDVDGLQVAEVVSSWGSISVAYKRADGGFETINVDFSALSVPEGVLVSRVGPEFIAAFAQALLDSES